MCFSDKRLLLYTAIITATIFVYKWTKHIRYCSVCSDQKFINVSHEKIDIKIEIEIFQKSNQNR